MIVIWNYGEYAQLEQDWDVWNWSGPAGADIELSPTPYYAVALGHAAPGAVALGYAAPGSVALGHLPG